MSHKRESDYWPTYQPTYLQTYLLPVPVAISHDPSSEVGVPENNINEH